ncbi:MAG: ERCC4 domain-containing protein [Pseudomonadota bacterium]
MKSEKIEIDIDFRERKTNLIDILKEKYKFDVKEKFLKIGDYCIGNRIIIERKTCKDFIVSIIDGRLFNQASLLKNSNQLCLFIIEGEGLYNTGLEMSNNSINGALISLSLFWQIPILFTKDIYETALFLNLIASQYYVEVNDISFRPGRKPKGKRKRQLYILQGLPNIGPKYANKLLDHFGSVEQVFTASVDDLKSIDGLGKKRAEKIKEIIS